MKMNHDSLHTTPVIVIGASAINNLGVIRSLGRHGIDITLINQDQSNIDRRSKYVSKFIDFDFINRSREELIDLLLKRAISTDKKSIIVPTDDYSLLTISKHQDDLEQYYLFPFPEYSLVYSLVNKGIFYKLISQWDMPHPKTYFPKNDDELRVISKEIPYPYIIKPTQMHLFSRIFHKKCFEISSDEKLDGIISLLKQHNIEVLIQEIIPGKELYSLFTFVDENHVPCAICGYDKIRQYPEDYGIGSLWKSYWRQVPIDFATKALKLFCHHGFAEAEFKFDPRDGQYKFLEINARPVMPNSLPAHCGTDIIYYAYLYLTGQKFNVPVSPENGVLWINEYLDIVNSCQQLRHGSISVPELIRSYRGVKTYAVCAGDDHSPAYHFALKLLGSLYHKIVKKTMESTSSVARRILRPIFKRDSRWSIGIYTGESPFHLRPINSKINPVLQSTDVSDINASFVADPFMVKDDSIWYMFFEAFNKQTRKGEIGYAISTDGMEWSYKQIVLSESFHLSYPYVFKWKNEYYMLPESSQSTALKLYKATSFPDSWHFEKNLLEGVYKDPSIFHYHNRWWLFCQTENSTLRLYHADSLYGPWKEHLKSPIMVYDDRLSRPGGRIVQFGNRIIRFAQDDYKGYGNRIHLLEISKLTIADYEENYLTYIQPEGENSKWNAHGMHNIDMVSPDGNYWVACLDGFKKYVTYRKTEKQAISNFELEPIDKLLALCARIELSPQDQETIQDILSRGIDCNYLYTKASWHRILVLVAHHLSSQSFQNLIPQDLREKLRRLKYLNLARNIMLQDEMVRLLTLFQQNNIPVIVLKGMALLDTIYKDISLRSMEDIDILIEKEDLVRAEDLVLEQGYQYRISKELQDQTRAEFRHLANLWHKGKNVMLEIHHHIVSPDEPYYFDISIFRSRAQKTDILGVPSRTFIPEDIIVHLSIKFLLDRRYQSMKALGQLCDISEIIKYYGDLLDWNQVKTTAQKHRLSSGLHFVLYACKKLLDTPIPLSVLNELKPLHFNPLDAELFIQRRVMSMKPWLAHGLADSTHNNSTTFQVMFSRLINSMLEVLRKKNTHTMKAKNPSLRDIYTRLFRIISNPSEFRKDLHLDDWLHNLQDK